jgi:uncharacterized protein involved in exopolysaccharide biosynthesis
MENNNRFIVRADKKLRIRYIIILAVIILIFIVIFKYFLNYKHSMEILAENNPQLALGKIVALLKVIIYINPIFFLAVTIYFLGMGIKTYRTEQFPPPNIRVIRNTQLLTGAKAKQRAIILFIFSILLIIFAVVITLFMNKFLQSLL